MKILFLFALLMIGFVVGCGSNENKVSAPEKFLAPTAPMGAGTGGKTDKDGSKTEKFVP